MNSEHARLLKEVKAGTRLLASLPSESWDGGLVLAVVRAGDRSAIKLLAEGKLEFTREKLALEAGAVDDAIFGKLVEKFKADPGIVLAAASRNSSVLQHVSTALKGVHDFVMQVVSKMVRCCSTLDHAFAVIETLS